MEIRNNTFDNTKELFNVTFGNIKDVAFPKPLSKLLNVNRVRLKRVKSELRIPLIFRKLEQRNSEPNLNIANSLITPQQSKLILTKRKLSIPKIYQSLNKPPSKSTITNLCTTERSYNKLQPMTLLPNIKKQGYKLYAKNFLYNNRVHIAGLNARLRCPIRPRIERTNNIIY